MSRPVQCRICKLDIADSDICNRCRETLGIVDMPPARRPATPCIKCRGSKLVRVIPRENTAGGGDYVTREVVAMHLTVVPKIKAGFFLGPHAGEPVPRDGRGMLEAYVCRACGYVEWYCTDPENIPIGPEYMTEEVDAGSGPYR
jgi:hypothetical protein